MADHLRADPGILPEQVQSLHRADKAALFSVVMAVGALASMLANPVAGALSDRTTSARGHRRPWTLAGAVIAPLIAGVVPGLLHNYPALFALAGLSSLAAGVTIAKVRSVP